MKHIYILRNYVINDGCIEADEVFAYSEKEDAIKHFTECVLETKELINSYDWEEEEVVHDDLYYCYCGYDKGYFPTNRIEIQVNKVKIL